MANAVTPSSSPSFELSSLPKLKLEPLQPYLLQMPAETSQPGEPLLYPASPPSSEYIPTSLGSPLSVVPDSDDQLSDDVQQRKRKPSHAACDNCRRLKIRCDGAPVCTQCTKRGATCVYSGSKKRGPKIGKLKQLQDQVAALSLLVEQQRQQLEHVTAVTSGQSEAPQQPQHKKRKVSSLYPDDSNSGANGLSHSEVPSSSEPSFFPRSNTMPPRPMLMPSPLSASVSTAMFILPEYVQVYKETVHPCMPVMRNVYLESDSLTLVTRGLQPTADFPLGIKAKASRALLNVYTVLGIGAWMQGNKEHSEEFMQRAVQYAREVFDETHYDTACGLDRLSYYFALLGNQDRARNYNALALQMCETLGLSPDSPLYTSCQLMRFKISDGYQEKVAASRKLMEAGATKAKVIGISGFVNAELMFNPARDVSLLLEMLGSAEKILDEIGNSPVSASDSSAGCPKKVCTNVPRITLHGLRSALYMHAGDVASARYYADQATIAMEQTDMRFLTFCTTVGLDFAAQVHAETGAVDMLRRDIAILKAIIPKYPLAEKTLHKVTALLDATVARVASLASKVQEIGGEPGSVEVQLKPAGPVTITTPAGDEMNIEWVERLLAGDDAGVAAMVAAADVAVPTEMATDTGYFPTLLGSQPPSPLASLVPDSPVTDVWNNWPST